MDTEMELGRGIRVLYVEDDEDDFFLAREYLNDIDKDTYDVAWAQTYDKGWEEILHRRHDLYLIDFRLGGQSGLDLIKAARDAGIAKPMILLTGLGDRKVDMAAMEAGADEFLSKDGLNSSLLERTIRYTLNQRAITEQLMTSEERLNDYVDTASDWIWEINAEFRFTSIKGNSPATDPSVPREAIIGMTRWELKNIDLTPEQWKEHQEHLENQQSFNNFEYPVIRPDGRRSVFQVSGKPVYTPDGAFAGYRGTGRDVTARHNLEMRLQQADKMRAVGQLTGGVAHDFNNILQVINSELELLYQQTEQDSPLIEKINKILVSTGRGARLTSQLLAFSHQQTLHPEIVSSTGLIKEVLGLLERTLGEDILIETELDVAAPRVRIDASMFGNAILNLAVNARDAMPNGGTLTVKIKKMNFDGKLITAAAEPVSGPYVCVSVTDTGTGIAAADLEHVFEPFFTTKNVGEGTGLGLSMVYGFVTQSAGHASIESVLGQGTTVNMFFPATEDAELTAGEQAAKKDDDPPGGRETILLVEDDEAVRDSSAALLDALGYTVFQAEDVPTALEKLKSLQNSGQTVNLVLSDIVMPSGLSGFDLADQIRENYEQIKVLLVSGYSDEALNQKIATSSNPTGFRILHKPYKLNALAKSLRALLDEA